MSKPCTVCSLPIELQNQIVELRQGGMSFPKIAKRLAHDYDRSVSKSSLERHFKNHSSSVKKGSPDGPLNPTPRVDIDGDKGSITTGGIKGVITDYSELLEMFDIDPTVFHIVGNVRTSRWQQVTSGEWLTSYRFNFERITADEDVHLPALFAELDKKPRVSERRVPTGRNVELLVNIADMQIGKVDSRGGTEELLARIDSIFHQVTAEYQKVVDAGDHLRVVIADVGDAIENFQNVAAQTFSNDLSLMKQLDLAGTIFARFINKALELTDDVHYIAVPSNHCSWRQGKNSISNDPSDDFGIYFAKQIERQYQGRVTVHVPDEYSKLVAYRGFNDFVAVYCHGDEFSPSKWKDYIAKQLLGGFTAISDAELFIYGHYHNFSVQTCGVTQSGRQRWSYCCPTLDNGSTWFRNATGENSQPGLLVHRVVDGDFDMNGTLLLTSDEKSF